MRTVLPWAMVSMGQAMAGPDGCPVVLRWNEAGEGAVLDETTGAMVGGAPAVEMSNPDLRGFWHEVTEVESKYRAYAEVAVGNGVLELPAGTVIGAPGRFNLMFEILGERWVQKEVGEALKATWEQWGGEKLCMTLLLKRQV